MSVTPDFIGQVYKDTNTGNLWRANSLTPGDWTLELQNMQMKWTPTSMQFGKKPFFALGSQSCPTSYTFEANQSEGGFQYADAIGLTSLSLPSLVSVGGSSYAPFSFTSCADLLSISAPLVTSIQDDISITLNPKLTTIDMGSLVATPGSSSSFKIDTNALLTSVNLGSLVTVASDFESNNTSLASLSLPLLVTVSGDWTCSNNSLLVTVSIPQFLPTNGNSLYFNGCALNAASVNQILARCVANAGYVSGTVTTNGGTSAAPSGQGVADKATLIGRGVSVTTN